MTRTSQWSRNKAYYCFLSTFALIGLLLAVLCPNWLTRSLYFALIGWLLACILPWLADFQPIFPEFEALQTPCELGAPVLQVVCSCDIEWVRQTWFFLLYNVIEMWVFFLNLSSRVLAFLYTPIGNKYFFPDFCTSSCSKDLIKNCWVHFFGH